MIYGINSFGGVDKSTQNMILFIQLVFDIICELLR